MLLRYTGPNISTPPTENGFNQFGDVERCALRPDNVHSAHEWRDVLEPVVDNEIATRLEDHARHARGAYAAETERAVRNDTAKFSAWCTDNDCQMLPALPETLVAFIDAVSETRAPATIRRYLSSISGPVRSLVGCSAGACYYRLGLKRIH